MMSLPTPKLDDRQFQDIVDEAKKRIRLYCPEWTDHNVSDPGVTMIELFAWMTEMILYRLNQVPKLHYIKLMEMLGITLQGPQPARTDVTFWLSGPQSSNIVVPAYTEVASQQTEKTERPIVFTTDEDLHIRVPKCVRVEWSGGSMQLGRLPAVFGGSGEKYVEIFSSPPATGEALYFGFESDLSNHVLRLDLDFESAGGLGIDPNLPPYEWQAWGGAGAAHWCKCDVEIDTTQGMNASGRVQIFLPELKKRSRNKHELYWVCARVRQLSDDEKEKGMREFTGSPRLRRIAALGSIGATVAATHAQVVEREMLGQSDGSPGQRFYLQSTPVLVREKRERLWVEIPGQGREPWTEQPDFADSDMHDPHYTLDSVTGELRLGPSVRLPNGDMKQYGKVPPLRAKLVFERYRYGGGVEGNVDAGKLNTLKTSIPYIDRVENRKAATGGLDSESLEAAMARAPQLLRSRDRAVTAEDFEYLARQALPNKISRVKCVQPRPSDASKIIEGTLYVLVIPLVSKPDAYLSPRELVPNEDDLATLRAYLDERRLLTTRISVQPPAYHWVSVSVTLRPEPGANHDAIQDTVLQRLYRFLNPLTGGVDGRGWPFGRTLYQSDIYQCLQDVPGILAIRTVQLYSVELTGDSEQQKPADNQEISLLSHGVIVSHRHTVEFDLP
ncbi:MAG: putative baseplate assembly protein [Nitrospirae bacterium]|nr:MAG: putative baseplate assembly protein [Nitrospirota bacterium]